MPYFLQRPITEKNLVLYMDFEPEIDGRLKSRLAMGRPLSGAEIDRIPRTLRVTEFPSVDWPEIMGWLNGPFVLCAQLRDKIEELEPGRHGFISLEVYSAKTSRKDREIRHLLYLTQVVDAVALEGTKFRHGFGQQAAETSGFNLYEDGPCVLKQSAVEGRHLWRGAGPGGRWPDYFCSDELGDFIKERSIRGWNMVRCEIR
jgi:hypothetical protein